jgi:hypothetical protein
MKLLLMMTAATVLAGQAQIKPVVSQKVVNDQVNVVRLAARFTTAIRLPEPVSSVVIGDPGKFLAEHSEKEPALVLVKPISEEATSSNLLITTVSGRHLSFLLRNEGVGAQPPVDFVLTYRTPESFLVEESGLGANEVSATERFSGPVAFQQVRFPLAPEVETNQRDGMTVLLERQQRAALPVLYGMRADTPEARGDLVKVGISEVIDQGQEVLVLFSVVNPQSHAIEILPPQIQLAGKVKNGFPVKRGRWGTSEQLAVRESRLSRKRIGPGERTDGVVVFSRPSFKQSNETLFLQVAESGAVDRPALAPIGFGVSAVRKEDSHDK